MVEDEEFSQSGEPFRLYQAAYKQGQSKKEPPSTPLLYVPSQPVHCFLRDLDKVGIPRSTNEGKLDFHAGRVAYINMLLSDGEITPKDVQELARHSTLDMTMNVYGRVRLRQAVEHLGHTIEREKRAICVQHASVPFKQKKRNPLSSKKLRLVENGSGGRARTYFTTSADSNTSPTESDQIHAKPLQQSGIGTSTSEQPTQNPHKSEQKQHISPQPGRVPEEYGIPDGLPKDLAEVVEGWDRLPGDVKQEILAMVHGAV